MTQNARMPNMAPTDHRDAIESSTHLARLLKSQLRNLAVDEADQEELGHYIECLLVKLRLVELDTLLREDPTRHPDVVDVIELGVAVQRP